MGASDARRKLKSAFHLLEVVNAVVVVVLVLVVLLDVVVFRKSSPDARGNSFRGIALLVLHTRTSDACCFRQRC